MKLIVIPNGFEDHAMSDKPFDQWTEAEHQRDLEGRPNFYERVIAVHVSDGKLVAFQKEKDDLYASQLTFRLKDVRSWTLTE